MLYGKSEVIFSKSLIINMKSTHHTIAIGIILGVSPAVGGLVAYDNQIQIDQANGLTYVAVSTTSFIFDGSSAAAFDFGATSGSGAIEFIVKGDPDLGGRNGFLAVGSNSASSLRYEQWDDTGVVGFTQSGVADYTFTSSDPPPPDNPLTDSPADLTHITYRWDHTVEMMELFVNGEITGRAEARGFLFPSGLGILGNNGALTEGMFGTIERATIYNEALDPAIIKAHSDAWITPDGSLAGYDDLIQADNASGDAPYTGLSSSTLTFDTTNSEAFDFGAVGESATAEFIVGGDVVAGGQDGFLGVGNDPLYSLRFEQWSDTGKLGFTHGGVADYTFGPLDAPAVTSLDSPTEFTHIVYRFDADLGRMELYVDGVLAGFNDGASGFELPTGEGFLGNNDALSEGMLGEIARVTVYDEAITPEAIAAHAQAWLGPDDLRPLQINDIAYSLDGANGMVSLTWNSRPGVSYSIDFSNDLGLEDPWIELTDSVLASENETTFSYSIGDPSATPKIFYRVTANSGN